MSNSTSDDQNPPPQVGANGASELAFRKRIAASIGSIAADWTELSMMLIKSGVLGIYLTSLLFVIGWAYVDRYFDIFGISLSALDGDVGGAFYIYALWALRDGWLFLLVSLASLTLVALLLALFSLFSKFDRLFAIFVVAACVMGSFLGAFRLGQWRAESQVPQLISRDWSTFPRVIVQAKKDTATAQFLTERIAGDSKDCLRKLYMDRKNIYLYPGYEDTKNSLPKVFIVPLSDVAGIEIIKNRGLCQN